MKLLFLLAAATAYAQNFSQRGFLETSALVFPQTAANDSGRVVGEALFRYEAFYKLTNLRFAGGIDARMDSHQQTARDWGGFWWDRTRRRPAVCHPPPERHLHARPAHRGGRQATHPLGQGGRPHADRPVRAARFSQRGGERLSAHHGRASDLRHAGGHAGTDLLSAAHAQPRSAVESALGGASAGDSGVRSGARLSRRAAVRRALEPHRRRGRVLLLLLQRLRSPAALPGAAEPMPCCAPTCSLTIRRCACTGRMGRAGWTRHAERRSRLLHIHESAGRQLRAMGAASGTSGGRVVAGGRIRGRDHHRAPRHAGFLARAWIHARRGRPRRRTPSTSIAAWHSRRWCGRTARASTRRRSTARLSASTGARPAAWRYCAATAPISSANTAVIRTPF